MLPQKVANLGWPIIVIIGLVVVCLNHPPQGVKFIGVAMSCPR